MQVNLYVFSKRRNSTARPTTAGASYSVVLKSPSSVVRPRIALIWTGSGDPVAYNYAYIPAYSRYYHIMEWTYSDRQWIADLSVDVLATCKNEIGSASKYVLRAAADMDGLVLDTKYPTKSAYTKNVITKAPGWAADPMFGSYVVGVVSPGGDFGSVSVFVLDNTEFEALRQAIAPSLYYNSIQDQDLKNLAITISNPMQYLAWVRYYPFTVPRDLQMTTMYLGDIQVSAHKLTAVTIYNPYTFDLTSHPLAATRGAYLSNEPYTARFFDWLPVGMIHIPALSAGCTQLTAQVTIDIMAGVGDLRLVDPNTINAPVVYRTSFSVGVDVPVAQVVSGNPLKIVSGAVSIAHAGLSAILGNGVGAVASGVSAISDFISSQIPEVQAYKPGSGSLMIDPFMSVVEYFSDVVDDDNTEYGRPLCKVRQISTLPGFVLCADGEISAAVTAGELAEIESFLTGGFFYE